MKHTKTASLEDLRTRHDRGRTLPDRGDAQAIDMPEGFWDDAKVVVREPKKSVHLRVDADVLAFFKSEGSGHLTRMNAVLRAYMEARK